MAVISVRSTAEFKAIRFDGTNREEIEKAIGRVATEITGGRLQFDRMRRADDHFEKMFLTVGGYVVFGSDTFIKYGVQCFEEDEFKKLWKRVRSKN